MLSGCSEEFDLRKIKNDKLKAEKISTKRQGFITFMVEGATPIPY